MTFLSHSSPARMARARVGFIALLSAALVVPALAAAGYAAPKAAAPAGAPSLVAQADPANDSDGDGTLDEANTASAAASARAGDAPVEDLSARTESTTTVVNPDGTATLRDFGSPVRVQNEDGTWADVDFDLVRRADGSYAPKVSATETIVGGGGTTAAAKVAFDDGSSLGISWPEALPTPQVEGGVATYRINDTTDLVVAVVDGGVSTNIRFNEKPPAADRDMVLGLRTDGLEVAETAQGGLKVTDDEGRGIGRTGTLVAWDARVDAAGDPAEIVPVAADLDTVAGSGLNERQELSLAPPAGFLDDPSTVYPVTIDPDISSVTRVRDTFVQNGDTTSNGTSHGLIVGAASTNTASPGVTFMQYDTSAVAGKPIVSAKLDLYQYYSYTCLDRQMLVQPVSDVAWVDAITWTNRPAGRYGTGDDASVMANRGTTGCGGGWTEADVTKMVAAWSAGTYTNRGFRLAVPSAYETYPSFERRFCSMNPNSSLTYCSNVSTKPYLSVTYGPTAPPTAATGLAFLPCMNDCDSTGPVSNSLTPTISAISTDTDTALLTYDWQVRQIGTVSTVTAGSTTAAQGTVATWQVPTGALADATDYEYRVRASDDTLAAWSGWELLAIDLDSDLEPKPAVVAEQGFEEVDIAAIDASAVTADIVGETTLPDPNDPSAAPDVVSVGVVADTDGDLPEDLNAEVEATLRDMYGDNSQDPDNAPVAALSDEVVAEAADNVEFTKISVEDSSQVPTEYQPMVDEDGSTDDEPDTGPGSPGYPTSTGFVAASSGDCGGSWWPTQVVQKSGKSSVSTPRRYGQLEFYWSATRLANLKCHDDVTFEPDFVTNNYDGNHYYAKKITAWASNMPNKYKDTQFADGNKEYTFTVGTSDARKLKSGKTYTTYFRTAYGNTTVDSAKINLQRGNRSPSFCHSTWCIFAESTHRLPETKGVWHSIPVSRRVYLQ